MKTFDNRSILTKRLNPVCLKKTTNEPERPKEHFQSPFKNMPMGMKYMIKNEESLNLQGNKVESDAYK